MQVRYTVVVASHDITFPCGILSTTLKRFKTPFSEAGEVREALEKDDMENLREELGDLLWAIVFTANISREKHLFDIEDILRDARAKMIRRHPHVFGDARAGSPEEAMWHFQDAKEREKHAMAKG